MTGTPIFCEWTDEGAMRPVGPTWAKRADQEWIVGARYIIVEVEDRSPKSHSHYFAALTEAWRNLPDELAERFPTMDALRKYALIRAGFRDERTFVCASAAEARRLATFMRPMDDFAVISAHDCAVVVWTAKSQSHRAMGREDFQRSKDAVLDCVASLIGSSRETLRRNAA